MVTMVTLIIIILNSSYLYIAQIFKYVMWRCSKTVDSYYNG